jgi:hypothetical protein
MDSSEIFIGHRPSNTFFSMNDDVHMFIVDNFNEEEQRAFDEGDLEYLVAHGKTIEINSQTLYRLYLGQISKGVCQSCAKHLGTEAGGKRFGELP